MTRPAALLFALVATLCLACGSGGTAETEELRLVLAETQERLAAAETRLATCECPDAKPAPAPATASPAPEAAATHAAPAGEGPSELEVKATSAVKVLIDGKGVSYNVAKSAYIKRNIDPGPHLLEVQSGLTRQVNYSETVEFQPGVRHRFQHKLGKKGLEGLGTVAVQ